jgi:hypothetical protein
MTRQPRTRTRSRLVALVAGLAASMALAAGPLAPSAGAHDGDAVLTVEATHPAGMSIHYIVRVTWADDGHPAADATVTATGVAPDGSQLTPVALAPSDDDGRYAGVVEYPEAGSWTVRITAIDPTGTLEQAQEVTAPTTTAPEAGGSEVTTGGEDGDSAATEGFAPEEDGTGASDEAAGGGSDDGGMPVYLLVAAGVVVLVGAATSINVIRRNRTTPTPGEATRSTSAGETTGEGTGTAEGTAAAGGTAAGEGPGTAEGSAGGTAAGEGIPTGEGATDTAPPGTAGTGTAEGSAGHQGTTEGSDTGDAGSGVMPGDGPTTDR